MKIIFAFLLFFSFEANAQNIKTKKELRQERAERIMKMRREKYEAKQKIEAERQLRIQAQWNSLGRHVFSFSALSFFTEIPPQNMQQKVPYGLGLSYEYFFSKNASIQTPVLLSLNTDYKKFGLSLKIYPGNDFVVKYAASPSLFFCTHKISDYYYDEYGFAEPQSGRRIAYGFSFDNSINIIASKHIYICMSAGPGVTFSEENKYKHKSLTKIYADSNASASSFITFNFNFFIGYRF